MTDPKIMSASRWLFQWLVMPLLVVCWASATPETGLGQSTPSPVGEWRTLSSFSYVTDLVYDDQRRIWGATTGGIFGFDPSTEKFVQFFTTDNGLSRLDPTALAYDNRGKQLIAGFPDGTLNVIHLETNEISVRNDIRRTDLFTDKGIREILVLDGGVYVATGFGIVTFDSNVEYVRQSFLQMGTFSVGTPVNDMTLDPATGRLWIATDQGIAHGEMTEDLSLSDNWTTEGNALFGGMAVQHLALFQQQVFASTASGNYVGEINGSGPDLITGEFVQRWTAGGPFADQVLSDMMVDESSSRLYGVYRYQLFYVDELLRLRSFTLPGLGHTMLADGEIWVGSYQNGLLYSSQNGQNTASYSVNGPSVNAAFGVRFTENGFFTGTSRFSDRNPLFDDLKGFSRVQDGIWTHFNMTNQPLLRSEGFTLTFNSLVGERFAYFGSWGAGIARLDLETQNIDVFNAKNTSIRGANNSTYVVISGLENDSQGDIWAVSRYANRPLIYHKEGTQEWTTLAPSNILSSADRYMSLFIDSNDQKWITLESDSEAGRGLMVMSTGQDPLTASDDRAVLLTTGTNSGNLPDPTVNAIIEDRNGEVWVGTERGIARFAFPQLILEGGPAERQAQWLIADEPGNVSPFLLRDISVTDMVVNGANQKWVATSSDGLWLLNEEGSRILAHYTSESSPLLSNTVHNLAYDERSGELVITTALGVVILTDVAVKGVDQMSSLSPYPNPFVYDRHQRVIIEGLSERSILFVVTVDGVRVRRLNVTGGRVEWDGLDQNGDALSSGVYLLIAIDENGGERGTGKIVVIR